jgi:hypothetical protein
MQEALSEPGMLVWRENDQGERIRLIIANAGREATGERTAFENSPDYKPVARRSASLIRSCQPGPSS